jgi:hypothetical protein
MADTAAAQAPGVGNYVVINSVTPGAPGSRSLTVEAEQVTAPNWRCHEFRIKIGNFEMRTDPVTGQPIEVFVAKATKTYAADPGSVASPQTHTFSPANAVRLESGQSYMVRVTGFFRELTPAKPGRPLAESRADMDAGPYIIP